jgi:two-component system LytT family response regulator
MIRLLIADDEAPARAKLRKLLADARDFEVVGEASDGDQAVERIRALRPDAVFLDIRMPKLDGFEVVEAVGVEAMPPVVFVTAYDEHALRAFDVHAFDYLLKPFAAARFRRVLDRLRRQVADRGDFAQRLRELLPRYLERLLVRKGEDREVLLPVQRIDVIRAERNHVRLLTSEGEYIRRVPLSDLAERLDPDRFLRINRSEIVRLDAVRELQPWFHGDCRVVMKDGTTLMWSRRYRSKRKDL